nr:hypothetical protein [Tanacetum cinerariifolium]
MDEEREAITTGLQNLWPRVPNLVFKHDEDDTDVSLVELFSSVDKTLTQRGNLNLVKLILDTDYDSMFKSHDEESEFEINSESFFVNSCFTHLYVEDCMCNPSGTVSWINLKSLCITYGKFDEVVIQNILSGSPLLEITMVINNCYGFRRIDITSNSVKNLVFSLSMDMDAELEDIGNIITINAPHILSLKINEIFCCELMLLDMSSLVKAYLDYTMDVRVPNKEQKEEDMLKRFILRLRHVKELRIGKHCLKALSRLEAKGFTVPSNTKYPDSDSTKSGDWYCGSIDYARSGNSPCLTAYWASNGQV